MRGKSIIVWVIVILCFALSNAWAGLGFNDRQVADIDFAVAADAEDHSFSKLTTLNLLAGCIGITFSGWLLRKRRAS
ncbi:MAG: hypothetical protein ACYSWO_28390 [Planctomycetota bacterium]